MHKLADLLFILTCLVFGPLPHRDAQPGQKYFLPDSTIGRKIILSHPASITAHVGDLMTKIDPEKALPDVYLANKDESQYLRLVFFPGSAKNSFGFFEVGEMTERQRNEKPVSTSFAVFRSESGIALGMSKDQLTAIKGNNYQVTMGNSKVTLRFTISDSVNVFLCRYNMPLYRAEYSFVRNKLICFSFGFEYP